MFGYRPPAEMLDETLRKAFSLEDAMDERFEELLDRLRNEAPGSARERREN